MSFLDLKSNSDIFLKDIQASIEKSKKGSFESDETSFYPKLDKEGNGFAIIRFMPPAPNETVPFVKIINHWFDGNNGRKYIENCPTTPGIGKPCPACEANSELWRTGEEKLKKLASSRKRKLQFHTNVYVVSDPKNPEREGGVFRFRFGVKIWEKVEAASIKNERNPNYVPFNPFDLWKGANFKLEIQKVDGNINYDLSAFESPSPLSDDDALLERAWKKSYTLQEIVGEDKFKDYDALKTKLQQVLGTPSVDTPSAPMASQPNATATSATPSLDFKADDKEVNLFAGNDVKANEDFFADI